ncbi:MAG: hypothetical protein ACLRXQ_12765 [Phascolarctobacterium faecium]
MRERCFQAGAYNRVAEAEQRRLLLMHSRLTENANIDLGETNVVAPLTDV